MINKNEETLANNYVNIITIEGHLTSDVFLTRCDNKNVYKATFYIKNPNKTGNKIHFNELYVVVYGRKAKDCSRILKKGDSCTVTGRLCLWEPTNDDSRCGATVIVSDIFW